MGSEMQETPADRTEIAQGRRIPDWLRPYKDAWLSAGKIKTLIAADGRYFGPWFDEVRPRLRSVTAKAHNGQGMSTKYLVRHVWAAALAHGLRLVPTDASRPVSELRQDLDRLQADLVQERARVRIQYVEVDKTGDSLEIVRLLVSSTEPQPKPGVYFLLGAAGEVLYVGQSKNVLSRMVGHAEKPYATVRMIHVEEERRRLEVESRLIEWLLPPLNLTGMGFRRESRATA